jgi:hypothetical protein
MFEKLRELAKKATPGPWELWDSCSWRRYGSVATGRTIVEPQTYSSTDRHPDLHFNNPHDKEYIAAVDPQTVLGLLDRIKHLEWCLAKSNDDVCQSLGKVLGAPWFKDDQKNFPGSTEEDGVCVGEHVAETMAECASQAITALERLYRDQRQQYRETVATDLARVASNEEWFNLQLQSVLQSVDDETEANIAAARVG